MSVSEDTLPQTGERLENRFAGSVAVVTGAGHGMGLAIAKQLAVEGANVVVAELDVDRGTDAVREIASAGGRAIFSKTDVGKPEDVDGLFAAAMEAFGDVHILINNAGFTLAKPLIDYTVNDWRRQMSTNLDGVFFCTQAAARLMIPRRRGKIVNFASTAAFVSTAMPAAAYCASKAGVRHLTEVSAAELAPHGINVNAVAPGTIMTNPTNSALNDPEKMARELARIPMGRLGSPSDVVGPVLFLCSRAADYVTGHVLVVDGGWLLF
jgi:gluconate 5-dehydrogenase